MKLPKEVRDQVAHALAAFAIVSVAKLLRAEIGILPGLFVGWSSGLIREVTEETIITPATIVHAVRAEFWLAFWALGGGLAGVI